jgi:hypothetical protein
MPSSFFLQFFNTKDTKNPPARMPEGFCIEYGTDKSKQIKLFWDGVCEYPEELWPLFAKLCL